MPQRNHVRVLKVVVSRDKLKQQVLPVYQQVGIEVRVADPGAWNYDGYTFLFSNGPEGPEVSIATPHAYFAKQPLRRLEQLLAKDKEVD